MLQQKVTLEKHLVEPGNIPARALYRDDGMRKPLIITVHGYTGNKNSEIDYAFGFASDGDFHLSEASS